MPAGVHMAKKEHAIKVAIAYDFDGTLCPGNMQEHSFIPRLDVSKKAFWERVDAAARRHRADLILMYMKHMLDEARRKEIPVRRADIQAHGSRIPLFAGVGDWFDRIDAYGRRQGLAVRHYIISSGLREMIEGTPIANRFAQIFASAFVYDENGVACWPAVAVNYTTKTQFLFRINKGVLDINEHAKVNEYTPPERRDVPFTNIIFIGDGDTDIPCFRLVKQMGGHSIAVYQPRKKGARERAERLMQEGRVHCVLPADYREGKRLDGVVKRILDKIAAHHRLQWAVGD
ncbi:MAG: hypothetical protein KatS3mg121_0416 [Gammaproteobacteria bacterium]|nr:MAG: hypothetical protein KatS3mg121_0416 [Gammaproteobacteria bacterium]